MTKSILLNTLFVLTMIVGTSLGQNVNTELLGHWNSGPCYTVAVSENNIFFGNGGAVEITDNSDISNPVKIAQISTPSFVEKIVYKNGLLYIANRHAGMRIIDVSNPVNPIELGHLPIGGKALDVFVEGTFAFVAADTSGVIIIDVSDPANPTEIGSYMTDGSARAVTINDDLAYVACGDEGLRILDISNPSIPSEIGYLATESAAWGIARYGTYVYVSIEHSRLVIVDAMDPANPVEVELLWGTREFTVEGDRAYAIGGAWQDGFTIKDLSNPANPETVGGLGLFGYSTSAHSITIYGSTAYVACEGHGSMAINVNDPINPVEISHYQTGSGLSNIAVINDLVYLADGYYGLRIIDASNPSDLVEIGNYNPNGRLVFDVSVIGSYAYLTTIEVVYSDGMPIFLDIINISDPGNPILTGSYSTGGYGGNLKMYGDYAIVTIGEFGFRIVDISDPADPIQVGAYGGVYEGEYFGAWVYGISVKDHYVYTTSEESGLRIIDIVDPTNPVEIAYLELDGDPEGYDLTNIEVSGDFAYVYGESDSITIIDISDPSNPTEIGAFFVGSGTTDMTIQGDLAYLTTDSAGLCIFDMSFGVNASQIGSFNIFGIAFSASVNGNDVYLAAGENGLFIVQTNQLVSIEDKTFSRPRSHVLHQNYPNPFNPTTTISYDLPEQSAVHLTIFNVQGRQIASLQDEQQPAGSYHIKWNGINQAGIPVSTGVYFARLEAGSYIQTIKMVYLR